MEFNDIIKKLEKEKAYAKLNYIPIIRDQSAKFLYDFVYENKLKSILEIGTAIGYSGSIILSAGALQLTTIDKNYEYIQIAKKTFEKFGFLDQVQILNDDAFKIIKILEKENKKFDMIFLDGPKGQYIKYLPILKNLLNNGGVIFADNVLLHGLIEQKGIIPHKKRTMVINLRKYLDLVNSDPFVTKIIRLEDGIAITKLKGDFYA